MVPPSPSVSLVSEGAVTLTTKFVLVFTAVLLIILGAVGEVTDRWAGATTPPAERAEHRASRSDSGRPREADHDLTHHDRPNLVLLPSVDDFCRGEQAVLPGQVDAFGTGTRDATQSFIVGASAAINPVLRTGTSAEALPPKLLSPFRMIPRFEGPQQVPRWPLLNCDPASEWNTRPRDVNRASVRRRVSGNDVRRYRPPAGRRWDGRL